MEKESSLFYDSLPLVYKEVCWLCKIICCVHINIGYIQFAVELKSCEELLGVIVANIDPAHVC